MSKQGILIVVSGPSGVGKDTIVNTYLEHYENSNCTLSVSATTRAPRPGEVDGINYHFVDEDAFQQLIDKDELLEWALYNGNYYGTPWKKVDEQLAQGKHVILVIEIQGAQNIRKLRPESVFVFMMPPSMECLEDRLKNRGTETEKAIARRLETAYEEMEVGRAYDFVIVNDDINETVDRFHCIVTAAESSPKYDPELLNYHLPQTL